MSSSDSTMPTENLLPVPIEPPNLPVGDSNDALLSRIKTLRNIVDQCYVHMARDLWTVFKGERFREMGYETFDDFVKYEVGISRDRANKLCRMFSKLVIKCDVRPDALEGIGRSKVDMILPIVDKRNADEWVQKAKELPYSKLELEVRKHKAKLAPIIPEPTESEIPITPSTPVVITKVPSAAPVPLPEVFRTRSFRLPEDVLTSLDEALAEAQRITGSVSDTFNLSCVLQHFLAHRMTQEGKRDGRLRYFMRHMEEIYGGRLLHIRDDRGWELLQRALTEEPNLFDTSEKVLPNDETRE